jgi:primase-polymerase (primpol)-like protein
MSASSPITLASLHASPIWVGWKNETPDGRAPTKVPYDPGTGRRAASDDASTWTTYDKAAQWVATNQAAGVGLMLCPVGDVFLAGVDLDSCRDKDAGVIAPWRRELSTVSIVIPR